MSFTKPSTGHDVMALDAGRESPHKKHIALALEPSVSPVTEKQM